MLLLQTPNNVTVYAYKFNDLDGGVISYSEDIYVEEVAKDLVSRYYPLSESGFSYDTSEGFPRARIGQRNVTVYLKKLDDEEYSQYNVLVVRRDFISAEKV